MHNKIKSIKENKNFKISFILNNKRIDLIPVYNDKEVIFKMASWREKFFHNFPGKFYLTMDNATNWLVENVIDQDDRLLFLIKDDSYILGHLGIFRIDKVNNSCELDNVLKGVENYSGLMTKSLELLIDFVFNELSFKSLKLYVFSDNVKAIKLYEKFKFQVINKIPLKKEIIDDFRYNWINCSEENAQRFYLEMILKNNEK
jgi:RimJ/RimL family protein N-acetyltransferase